MYEPLIRRDATFAWKLPCGPHRDEDGACPPAGIDRGGTRLLQADVAYSPLHQQRVVWAARGIVTLVQQADNGFPLRSVRVGN